MEMNTTPTAKQISYAMSLLKTRCTDDRADNLTASGLRTWTRREVSALIDELKSSGGYQPSRRTVRNGRTYITPPTFR